MKARRATGPTKTSERGETVHGLRAVRAIWVRRPGDVIKIGYAPALTSELEDLLGWASGAGVPARAMDDRELAAATGTQNHEGLIAEVKPRRWASMGELADALIDGRGAALALDRVRNPYNVGAILRSAAFFGIDGVLLGAPAPHPALAPDALRVAEGGAEDLILSRTTDLAPSLAKLRARGVHVIGAESDGAESVHDATLPRPVVIVLGHEREGLSDRVRATCERMVTIPGGGLVGSLNVAVTAGVFCASVARGR